MYIVFKNKGVIDRRAVTTFGASSKENASAIGFFGTGLKYAIAILLREECDISILAGKVNKWTFGTRRDKIRVDTFDFVTMNNRVQGFTTEVGKNWEMWMAFRELYCNCLDEGGEVYLTERRPENEAGMTQVVVRGAAFLDVWHDRGKYILDQKPLWASDELEVHAGPSEVVFYRGVRAFSLNERSVFKYNILRKVGLTEDRTIDNIWDVNNIIRKFHTTVGTEDAVRQAVTAPEGHYEARLDYGGTVPGPNFLSVVSELTRAFDSRLNKTAMKAAQVWTLENLHDNIKPQPLNKVDQIRLDRAVAFCAQIGFNVSEYPIIVTEFLGEEVLGRAHEGKIYISKRTLMMGTKMLAGTLIEEFIHLRHSLYDETRTMQNFLMDAIVSLGEQVTGEPL